MSVAFMTNQIQTKAPLEFVFVDNEIIHGKLVSFDAYTLRVISETNEYLIQKHALKYIKKEREVE
jgi:sRNA-binding regulator protein Hfq